MNSIFTRRSVRTFAKTPVEEGKVETILRAAMQAPSSGNGQPWEFFVVRGAENLAKLSEFSSYAKMLKDADVGIIVFGNKDRMNYPENWEQDLGAVTQNILLEATELQLGSVWLGCAPDENGMKFIRELYDLGENMLPYSVIAIGYPLKDNANHFVDRYDATRVRYID